MSTPITTTHSDTCRWVTSAHTQPCNCDARIFTVSFEDDAEQLEIENFPEWYVDNDLGAEEASAIVDLKVGERATFGGGAAPYWHITRVR